MNAKFRLRSLAMLILLGCGLPCDGFAENNWRDFLRRSMIETIELSPDGNHLAMAERGATGTVVVIRDRHTLEESVRFDPGTLGEVPLLQWIDNDRLVIGANRADSHYRVALVEPALYIVGRDGRSKAKMPANFLATIDGDPEHLLVTRCSYAGGDGCIDQVHRVKVGHTTGKGDLVISAPDARSELVTDGKGQVRFAISWNEESQSRLQVHRGRDTGWTLVNDATTSGVDSIPLGIDADGRNAFLLTDRKQGTAMVERFSIEDGKRSDVYADPVSDPIWMITSLDGEVAVGAYFDPVRPRPVLWDTGHPDIPALKQMLGAFPGKLVRVVSASADRNLVVLHVSSDTRPGDFYLFDLAARHALLLAPSAPWLSAREIPTSRGVSFKARDGEQLHAVLTTPVGRAQVRLPMVVVAHGGPYGVFDHWGYDAEAALLASQGFAVLRVNFRGSGGYGLAFLEKGYREWGRAMQDDITDATHWAIDQGHADPAKVCLYGMSYGGYAALMGAVREPALYRCVAGYAAPYDLAKMYRWGSIRRSDLGLKYLETVLGKDKIDLAARSPAQQAAAIKVPVLLAHGKLDARVAVQHSRALAKAMRKAGTRVEVIEYPSEGHWLAIDADREDFYTRLLAFLKDNTD